MHACRIWKKSEISHFEIFIFSLLFSSQEQDAYFIYMYFIILDNLLNEEHILRKFDTIVRFL